jgi:lysophospholipase L1-like esterase
MNLTFEQIKSITTGAVSVTQESDGIHFYRFTQEQAPLRQPKIRMFEQKVTSSAGVRLCFRTDSQTLYLRTTVTPGSACKFFSFDLLINGVYTDSLENFSHLEIPESTNGLNCELGTFEKTFCLGPGTKDIDLFFPWSVTPALEELSLDDGANVTPNIPAKKLLVYGDSITHGYNTFYSSKHYVSQLALALDAQVFNKGIGGATTFPEMALAKEPFDPDYIVVAYGSNDWDRHYEDFFTQQYRAMLQAVTDNYPKAQVFSITPVWRGDQEKRERKMGPLSVVDRHIRAIAADFPNVTVIPGIDLVPHALKWYADAGLHPNDDGYGYYFENLWPKIKAALKD